MQNRSLGPPMDNDNTPASPAEETDAIISDIEDLSARIVDDIDAIKQIMLTGYIDPLR